MLSHNNGNLFHGLHVHGSSVYKTKRVQLDAPSVNVMDMTGANVSARTVETSGVLGTAAMMMTIAIETVDSGYVVIPRECIYLYNRVWNLQHKHKKYCKIHIQ